MDVAQLGFAVDTGGLKDGKASLDALVPAAVRVETATDKVAASFNGAGSAADNAARGFDHIRTSATGSISPVMRVAEGYDILTGKMNNNFLAINNNIQKMRSASTGIDDVGRSLKFTAREGLGFSRQFADIGVTAAMGMSPFMIALQQGPQLFDILQEKAIQSGVTLGAVFRALGATIWTALAPILPIVAAIAGAVALVAGAFALGARDINKSNDDVLTGLGLTEKQLKKVEKAGVDTTVTLGDTFGAFFEVLGERITWLLGGPLKWLSDAWSATMDFITKYGAIAIKGIIGGFVGAYYAIRAAWGLLPAAVGDIAYSAANAVISGVEMMINNTVGMLNVLLSFANTAAAKMGLPGLGEIAKVDLGRIANPFAGAAGDAGQVAGAAFGKGFAEGGKSVDRFFKDVSDRAVKNRRDAIRKAAGDPEKGNSGAKGGKTDAEKFEDIVTGAENDIAAQKARADAVQLSAEAAATLEQKTKLLNEAQTKGIALTDGMRTKIDELAGAYGKAKVAADNAIALRDILKTADSDIANLKSQAELIGLTGRQLAYQTEMQKLLNDAKAKGLTVDAQMRAQFEGKAGAYADQSQANAHDDFMAGASKNAAERKRQLEEELSYIGKSADEVARLRIENELLAQARQKNIDLTPADIAAIGEIAKEQAELEKRIRKTAEALDFAKGTTKDFFKDLFNGLRQGKSLWESLGESAVTALNKIIERLMDKALTALVDWIFSMIPTAGGGGGPMGNLFGAGGAFGTSGGVQTFAQGGAFTNSIVDRATMFASGGALGVMGEAGPEAIMPLKRGSDGSLGVQMHSGGGNTTVINAPISIKNDNRVTGAVSSADIVAMQRAAAERTKNELKREIPTIIQQYQRDGAVVS